MSKLSDEIAAVRGATDALAARVAADIGRLSAEIADLKAKVTEGTATPEDFAALESVAADLADVDPAPPSGGGA